MAILLLFNKKDFYTVNQITNLTKMKSCHVVELLNFLIKNGLLEVSPGFEKEEVKAELTNTTRDSPKNEFKLNDHTIITCNSNFKRQVFWICLSC